VTTQEPPEAGRRRQGWNALKSAHHAFSGLLWVAPRTPSIQLGIAVSAALVGLGLLLRLAVVEIALLILATTMLLAVETLNTAVEMLCDRVNPDPDPGIGRIKDVAAAATAFCEIGTAFVVLLVAVPHVASWLGR
jgi:diacylglycerol kinase (ATP)